MGQSCNLYINPKWDGMTIKAVVELVSNKKFQWKPTGQAGYDTLTSEGIMIHVFWNSRTPIGTLTHLSRGACGAELLREAGKVIGGLFEANDCDGKLEFIDGKTAEGNALPYFVNYAITHDGADPNSIPALINSITKWGEEIKSGTNIIMPSPNDKV